MRIGIDCRKIADFGIGTYIQGLLGGLARIDRPEEVVVITRSDATHLVPVGGRFEVVENNAANYSLHELASLTRTIRRTRLDLFHATHYVVPFFATPFVVTIHDLIHLDPRFRPPSPLAAVYAHWMISRAVSGAERIVTVSEATRSALVERFGCRPDGIVVTPCGVSQEFFEAPSPETIKITAAKTGATPGSYFLYAGNDKPHKNLVRLMEAFELARREEPHLRLVLAGAAFEKLGNPTGVIRSGYVSKGELIALYAGAVALIMPSIEEGFGLPLLEAMAGGTPAVTSRASSLIEIGGDAAIAVPADSVPDLASAILMLARDPSLRKELSARAALRARQFTWTRTAELTMELYRRASQKSEG